MRVGKQEATKMLEIINQSDEVEDSAPIYPVFSKQNKNFETLDSVDNHRLEKEVVSRKPVLSDSD